MAITQGQSRRYNSSHPFTSRGRTARTASASSRSSDFFNAEDAGCCETSSIIARPSVSNCRPEEAGSLQDLAYGRGHGESRMEQLRLPDASLRISADVPGFLNSQL